MGRMIAICGLDCGKCDAYIATKNNDDTLRREVAEKWSRMNNVEILPEMINCEGCRIDGRKTPFCESLCPIRQCALKKKMETCGHCKDLASCETVRMITDHNDSALDNLRDM